MENSRENILKLLEVKYDNYIACGHIMADSGKINTAEILLAEAGSLWSVIQLFRNKEYFNTMWEAYKDDIK